MKPTENEGSMAELMASLLTVQKELLAAQQEANGIARASRRAEENAELKAAETVRQAEEAHAARALAIVVERVRLVTVLELSECRDAPHIPVQFTAEIQRVSAGERGKVSNIHEIDLAEVERVLRANVVEKYQGNLDDARRAADTIAEQEIMQRVNGRSAEGVMWRRWSEAWQPLLRRVVGKCIEDLIADGIVQVVDSSAKAAE